jgi:hypothetical protein
MFHELHTAVTYPGAFSNADGFLTIMRVKVFPLPVKRIIMYSYLLSKATTYLPLHENF